MNGNGIIRETNLKQKLNKYINVKLGYFSAQRLQKLILNQDKIYHILLQDPNPGKVSLL